MEFTLPISLDEEFVSIFDTIGERCYTDIRNSDGNAMTCLSKNGKSPVLYVKLEDETVFFDENGEPIGHREYRDLWFRSDAVVRIESVYAADDVTSVQMKLHEVWIRSDLPSDETSDKTQKDIRLFLTDAVRAGYRLGNNLNATSFMEYIRSREKEYEELIRRSEMDDDSLYALLIFEMRMLIEDILGLTERLKLEEK
ncbi:Hypothetical predicted protein [Paramuricea clavata]|uniref:Uncharacterized protein n=1 Tax=Paramuricea clavata TaxID=317549 RepID=A0A6S7JI02_PARCT|nr:Hypothetical predicted protein [Paramuricea clavata]